MCITSTPFYFNFIFSSSHMALTSIELKRLSMLGASKIFRNISDQVDPDTLLSPFSVPPRRPHRTTAAQPFLYLDQSEVLSLQLRTNGVLFLLLSHIANTRCWMCQSPVHTVRDMRARHLHSCSHIQATDIFSDARNCFTTGALRKRGRYKEHM